MYNLLLIEKYCHLALLYYFIYSNFVVEARCSIAMGRKLKDIRTRSLYFETLVYRQLRPMFYQSDNWE